MARLVDRGWGSRAGVQKLALDEWIDFGVFGTSKMLLFLR